MFIIISPLIFNLKKRNKSQVKWSVSLKYVVIKYITTGGRQRLRNIQRCIGQLLQQGARVALRTPDNKRLQRWVVNLNILLFAWYKNYFCHILQDTKDMSSFPGGWKFMILILSQSFTPIISFHSSNVFSASAKHEIKLTNRGN